MAKYYDELIKGQSTFTSQDNGRFVLREDYATLKAELEKAYDDKSEVARWNLALISYMNANGLEAPNSTQLMAHLPPKNPSEED